jgi:hypothetical protein
MRMLTVVQLAVPKEIEARLWDAEPCPDEPHGHSILMPAVRDCGTVTVQLSQQRLSFSNYEHA